MQSKGDNIYNIRNFLRMHFPSTWSEWTITYDLFFKINIFNLNICHSLPVKTKFRFAILACARVDWSLAASVNCERAQNAQGNLIKNYLGLWSGRKCFPNTYQPHLGVSTKFSLHWQFFMDSSRSMWKNDKRYKLFYQKQLSLYEVINIFP